MSLLIKGMEIPNISDYNGISCCLYKTLGGQLRLRNNETGEFFDVIPAADVRPVVLCRDCYAYRCDKEPAEAAYLDPNMYCGLLRCEMSEGSFCSYGKRKEET